MPFRLRLALPLVVGFSSFLFAQTATLPAGSELQVVVERDSSMKIGREVRAKTTYPLYLENRLVIPAGSEVLGKITGLSSATREKSRSAKLGGDFTPQHEATIQFDRLVVSGDTTVPLVAETVGAGAQVVRFTAIGGSGGHSSLIKRLWAMGIGREKEAVRTFTAPNKMERVKRAVYAELPYHPELLFEGTQYTIALRSAAEIRTSDEAVKAPEQPKAVDSPVTLAAELVEDVDSKQAKPGTKVQAVVTEPLFDANHNVKVPQGSVLMGEVTQAQAAGKWGKTGALRFAFRELQFPAGFTQRVHGAPTAIDMDQSARVQLDEEGGAKPAPKSIVAPLLMGVLATTAVHEEHQESSLMHTGGASNGFALIGRVAALASNSHYVGAVIGFYGTGRAVYSRFLSHGKDIDFPKGTRIEVELSPDRANALKP